MSDRVFAGGDVSEALATAAQTLGLPQRELRYVVLDEGRGGGRGLMPTPARIAVLLQEGPRRGPERSFGDEHPPAARSERPAVDVRAGIRGLVRAMGAAGGLDLECEIEEHESMLVVELRGPGCSVLYGADADGEPLRAVEHLLLRMFGEALRPQGLRVRCEGFRERREAALGARARQLAADVRSRGEAVALEPMNAYERRLVHVALQDEPGVRTRSEGEGSARRVQIVPAGEGPEPGGRAEARTEAGESASEGRDGR